MNKLKNLWNKMNEWQKCTSVAILIMTVSVIIISISVGLFFLTLLTAFLSVTVYMVRSMVKDLYG